MQRRGAYADPATGVRRIDLEQLRAVLATLRCEIDREHDQPDPDPHERDDPIARERLAERDHREQELTGRREVLQEADRRQR